MTTQLFCVVGVLLLGGDPTWQDAGGVRFDPAASVSAYDRPGDFMAAGVPAAPGMVEGQIAAPVGSMAPSDPPIGPPGAVPSPSMDQIKAEMKKLAWTKGDFTVIPYGILWGNTVYETQRTQVGDYTLYVLPERPNTNQQYHLDARSTRLGIDVLGPRIPVLNCAPGGGKIEFDFQRLVDTENRSGVLLRHAYVEVKDEEFRLLFGQTWDLISPLYPGMLMYSVGWGGGNIGYRRAQLRGERYLELCDDSLLTLQGSLNTNIVQEINGVAQGFPSTAFTGDQSGWPVLMARVGTTLGPRGPGCYPMDFGVSAHIGEQIFDSRALFFPAAIGVPKKTWSLNADLRIPITPRFGVQAEFFTGANLGAYFGGILQGVDVGTLANPGTLDPIRSTGGWFDVWYDWTPRLHSHAGYSIDDPVNRDVTAGRIYNAFAFANLSYDLTQKFLVGVEVSSWKTHWVGQPDGDAVVIELAAKYGF